MNEQPEQLTGVQWVERPDLDAEGFAVREDVDADSCAHCGAAVGLALGGDADERVVFRAYGLTPAGARLCEDCASDPEVLAFLPVAPAAQPPG